MIFVVFGLLFALLDVCVSSLRRGHVNILCIVPCLTDDPRRESTFLLFVVSLLLFVVLFCYLLVLLIVCSPDTRNISKARDGHRGKRCGFRWRVPMDI